jgi:hypothetical protein
VVRCPSPFRMAAIRRSVLPSRRSSARSANISSACRRWASAQPAGLGREVAALGQLGARPPAGPRRPPPSRPTLPSTSSTAGMPPDGDSRLPLARYDGDRRAVPRPRHRVRRIGSSTWPARACPHCPPAAGTLGSRGVGRFDDRG